MPSQQAKKSLYSLQKLNLHFKNIHQLPPFTRQRCYKKRIRCSVKVIILCLQTEMKRTNADKLLNLEHAEAISSSSRHLSEGLSTEVSSASSSRSRSSSSSIIKDKHSPIIKVRMGDIEEGNNVQLLSASPKTST